MGLDGVLLGLIIGVVALALTVLSLLTGLIVFWYRMSSVVKTTSEDVKDVKKNMYAHMEKSALFETTFDASCKAQHTICKTNEANLAKIASDTAYHKIAMDYMAKVFDEIKRLVDANTQVAREIKGILEKGYGSKN